MTEPYDVLIVGGGPAGLSAALNLGRALARVLVIDADRPRNAATLNSHGFLTRDGVPPHELRRIARDELAAYPNVEVRTRVRVASLTTTDAGFSAAIGRREPTEVVSARSVLLATGLRETLPDVPNLRGFYGMSLFSCAACDAWELRGRRLALIGETPDLADRARLISRWTESLTVFTNGAAGGAAGGYAGDGGDGRVSGDVGYPAGGGAEVVSTADEAELAAAGVAVVRHPIAELVGERGRIAAVRLADGREVEIDGGFVRPEWDADLSFLDGIAPARDDAGHLLTDRSGRTDVPGLYAAGDVAAPGPQQLIVAAGAGARVAAVIVHDTIGVATAH